MSSSEYSDRARVVSADKRVRREPAELARNASYRGRRKLRSRRVGRRVESSDGVVAGCGGFGARGRKLRCKLYRGHRRQC